MIQMLIFRKKRRILKKKSYRSWLKMDVKTFRCLERTDKQTRQNKKYRFYCIWRKQARITILTAENRFLSSLSTAKRLSVKKQTVFSAISSRLSRYSPVFRLNFVSVLCATKKKNSGLSAEAVEYADCIFAEVQVLPTHNKCLDIWQ